MFMIVECLFLNIRISTAYTHHLPSRPYLSTKRMTYKPALQMALKLETISIPVQLNPREYINQLRTFIPHEDIIRWYIAKIENGIAVIEVVRETNEGKDKK